MVDVDLGAVLGDDVRGQVGERDADAVVVEVDADGDAGRAVEAEKHGRSAPTRLAVAVGMLDDEPARLEVGDDAADRRPREPGQAGELAAARRSLPAERVEDPNAVALAQDSF